MLEERLALRDRISRTTESLTQITHQLCQLAATMRCALLLLALGASVLTADAISCYSCTACSETFSTSEVTTSTSCSYCGKSKVSSLVSRTCLPLCVAATDSSGNGLHCCSTDLCNSAHPLRGASWPLLLMSAAALTALCTNL